MEKQEFDIEVLYSELLNLRGAMEFIYDHFAYDYDYIKKDIALLLCRYRQYGGLYSVCMNTLDDIIKAVDIDE